MEVMVSIALLTVVALSLLQAFEVAFRCYGEAQKRWRISLHLWNRTEAARNQVFPVGEPQEIIPGARPLFRALYSYPSVCDRCTWEVFRAEK